METAGKSSQKNCRNHPALLEEVGRAENPGKVHERACAKMHS